MRRTVASFVAALVLVGAAMLGCNAIFDIVPRYAGPTWCEADAQTVTNGYCEDFDRSGSGAGSALPADLNGSAQVTDSVASSLPNSLGIMSGAAVVDGGALVGNLVSFGPAAVANTFAAFSCQLDLRASELDSLVDAGVNAGILGVGGQELTGEPEIVALSFSGGSVTLSLEELADPQTPPMRLGPTCQFQRTPEGLTQDWLTISASLTPELGRADFPDGGCTLEKPGSDSKSSYVLKVSLGPIETPPVRVKVAGFMGQPYFVYGLFVSGKAPPLAFHIDNARCTMTPAGGR